MPPPVPSVNELAERRREEERAERREQHEKRRAARQAWRDEKRHRHSATRAARRQRKAEARAKWLPRRHKPRPTIGVRLGVYRLEKDVLSQHTYGQYGGLELGKRWQVSDQFGLLGSGLAHSGRWVSSSEFDDRGDTFGLRAQVTPYFGPYKHLIFGPTLTLGKNWYSVDSDNETVRARSDSAWISGWGLQGGVILGHTEAVQILMGVLFSGQREEGPAPLPVSTESMEANISASFAF